MGFNKSTLVARGATRQLDPSCLNHPQLAIDRTGAYPAIVCMWATVHAVNIERIERWYLCEYGMPFPCGLPIVVRLLVWPPPGSAFHWNSVRRGLSQTVNSNWRGSPRHFFVFCSFLS